MRLPFFYGWLIVVVTFVTMAIGVNARTAFSLFFPPIIDEFGWERGVTAGAFSFGFVVSGAVSPLIGRMMDRFGPRGVMELGVALMGGGLLLAPLTTQPWHLYLTIGVLVGAGSVCLGYSGQSLFLPNWFIRRRGLAMGLAFAGVGIGSVTLLPWVQHMIEQTGWRTACTAMGILVLVVLAPINLLLRKRPEDIGLLPDGDAAPTATSAEPRLERRRSRLGRHRLDAAPRAAHRALLVDLARLFLRPVHLVRGAGAPDQIPARHRLQPERRGVGARRRQPARHSRPDLARASLRPDRARMDLGDQLRRLCDLLRGADRAEIRAGVAAGLSDDLHAGRARLRPDLDHGRGGAGDLSGQAVWQHLRHHHAGGTGGRRRGPWATGLLYDLSGSYTMAFAIGIAVSMLSAIAIWQASPGKVRAVAGQDAQGARQPARASLANSGRTMQVRRVSKSGVSVRGIATYRFARLREADIFVSGR